MVPALLAPIKNEQGILQGIVRIFLNADGNKLNATYIDHKGIKQPATVKANLGSLANAAVIVNQGSNSNTIYIAEGINVSCQILYGTWFRSNDCLPRKNPWHEKDRF